MSLIGHISRDGTAIKAREERAANDKIVVEIAPLPQFQAELIPAEPLPAKSEEVTPIKIRRGRPRKGEVRTPKVTKIEQQKNQPLAEIIAGLPKAMRPWGQVQCPGLQGGDKRDAHERISA